MPLALDLRHNKTKAWSLFKQKWTNFEIATGLKEKEEDTRLATLLSIIGDEALEAYNGFQWDTDADKLKIEKVLDNFEKYCNPKRNVPFERYVFNSRFQKSGETIDEYVNQLRLLAESCEFGSLKDSLIRDMVIFGCNDERLKESMLREPDLSLQRAIKMCRLTERAKDHHNKMSKRSFEEIDKITTQKNKNVIKCKFCNKMHERNLKLCPARGKACKICSGMNHFASVCKFRKINEVSHEESGESDESEEIIIS